MQVNLPSVDFLGISAETGLVIESDFENGAERATVFAGITVHTNVILTAIIGMSVTTESPGGDITSGRANESTSNFYYTSNNLKKKKKKKLINSHLKMDVPTCLQVGT